MRLLDSLSLTLLYNYEQIYVQVQQSSIDQHLPQHLTGGAINATKTVIVTTSPVTKLLNLVSYVINGLQYTASVVVINKWALLGKLMILITTLNNIIIE